MDTAHRPPSETGRALIVRNSPKDIKMRDLYVRVDDLDEDTMLYGDSLEFSLSPGDHRVKVTNRIHTKTLDFRVSEGETVRLSAANIPSRGVLSLFMVFSGTVPYKVAIWPG